MEYDTFSQTSLKTRSFLVACDHIPNEKQLREGDVFWLMDSGINHHGRGGMGTGAAHCSMAAHHRAQTRKQKGGGQMWAWAITLKACPPTTNAFSPARPHLV